jgi:signal transduction histidine kinase
MSSVGGFALAWRQVLKTCAEGEGLAFDWLSEWLRPPPDAADDPARARALRWILLGFAATALFTTGVVLLSPGWHRAAPVSLAVLGFWAAAYAMIRRNRLRSATWILVWGLFITVVSGAALGGGLTSPSLPTLSVVILAAGLLLGGRAAVAVSAVCTLSVGVFYAVEEAGLMPAALFVHQNVSTALVHVSGLVGSFLVIASAGVWIQRTSARSTRYEEALEARNRELTLAIEKEREAEKERQQLEVELRQAQKMDAVGRLAGGIAHDFNNLLTVIGGFSEVLLDELDDKSEARYAADQILMASDRAADLTQQILSFSRRPVHRPEPVDLHTLVREVEPMVSRLIGENIDVNLRHTRDRAVVLGDRSLLEQVILNLVVNARDALPEGGRIEVATRVVDIDGVPHACLAIRDEGVGMTPDIAAHAFEPFYTTKEQGQGTGLGLSIAYGIVQQLGGTIRLDSELGRGTEVEIRLALHEGAVPVQQGPLRKPLVGEGVRGRRVLVVEDDDRVRGIIVHALESRDHEVMEARNGDEALRVLVDRRPLDLLVTDVVMPGMNGFELVKRVRSDRAGLLVLFMSGYAKPAGTSLREIPSDAAFLQKPFGPRALLEKVDAVLTAE